MQILKKDINFSKNTFSTLPIEVVLVSIQKDYNVLIHTIESIKKNVRHPIKKIIVISSKSNLIRKLCKETNCVFIDENTVLPITKKDIKYVVNGIDRSGWLFQQLLKYEASKYCRQKYYLVTESDTLFIRPRVFEQHRKIYFPCSGQLCHIPYFISYRAILGKTIKPYINFTSHHVLINKRRMKQLKTDVEAYCKKPWYKAIIENIDKTNGSAISDYETYGQYIYNNFIKDMEIEYWSNISLKRDALTNTDQLSKKYGDKFKTVSFHSYNQ